MTDSPGRPGEADERLADDRDVPHVTARAEPAAAAAEAGPAGPGLGAAAEPAAAEGGAPAPGEDAEP